MSPETRNLRGLNFSKQCHNKQSRVARPSSNPRLFKLANKGKPSFSQFPSIIHRQHTKYKSQESAVSSVFKIPRHDESDLSWPEGPSSHSQKISVEHSLTQVLDKNGHTEGHEEKGQGSESLLWAPTPGLPLQTRPAHGPEALLTVGPSPPRGRRQHTFLRPLPNPFNRPPANGLESRRGTFCLDWGQLSAPGKTQGITPMRPAHFPVYQFNFNLHFRERAYKREVKQRSTYTYYIKRRQEYLYINICVNIERCIMYLYYVFYTHIGWGKRRLTVVSMQNTVCFLYYYLLIVLFSTRTVNLRLPLPMYTHSMWVCMYIHMYMHMCIYSLRPASFSCFLFSKWL